MPAIIKLPEIACSVSVAYVFGHICGGLGLNRYGVQSQLLAVFLFSQAQNIYVTVTQQDCHHDEVEDRVPAVPEV